MVTPLSQQHYKILDTADLTDRFEEILGREIIHEDRYQIYDQLFQILDRHRPEEMAGRGILDYSLLVFANNLTFDRGAFDQASFEALVYLHGQTVEHQLYTNGQLMYFPVSLNGPDLCVRRYNS